MTMLDENAVHAESQPAGRAGAEEQESSAMTTQQMPEVKVDSSASTRPTTSSSAAADSPPPSRGSAASSTATTAPQQRNASSKFASLRAAFEKKGGSSGANGSPEPAGRQRLASSSDLNVGKTRERNQEYETEMAKLKAELEKERELRVVYEHKVGYLEQEIDAGNEMVSRQAEELKAAEEKIHQLQELENARAGSEEGSDEDEGGARQHRNQDSAALRRQLSDLKRNISRSTRSTGQLTDTNLRQEIGLLQYEVQNWVVNNFRKVKTEATAPELCEKLTRIAEPDQVVRLRPLYEAFDIAAKLAIYQATVAVYMMEIFSDSFLFGLRGQQDWARRTRQAAETLPAALDAATYSRWRAVTFSALKESEAVREPIESAAGAMAEMICITLNAMTEMEESEARLGSLRTIVRRAILLAHQVRSQQAGYDFVLPAPGDAFEAASMDDIVDDGEEAGGGRSVKCATFPSLFKSVDDEGVGIEPRKAVFRAKVLCREAGDG